MPITVTCNHCGQSKSIPPSQYKRSKTKKFYCDQECHSLDRQNRIQLACKQCGQEFTRNPSSGGEFCSHTCHMTWQWENNYEQRKENMVGQPSENPGYDILYDLHVTQNINATAISKIYGVQPPTARKWIHQLGIPYTPDFTTQWAAGQEPANKLPIPDREQIESLYCEQKLTAYQIAEQLSVSSGVVYSWLDTYDIPRRPAGIGLVARGQKPPTKKQLNRMIHEQGMTYQEVADRYDVDLTAVPYWLDKHGLSRPQRLTFSEQHADPESQQMIRSLYEDGFSLRKIADQFGVTKNVIGNYLREIGVEIRRDGWDGGKRFECKDDHLVRSSYELRVDNWLYENGVEHIYEPQLPFDPRYNADFLANGWYIEVWGVNNSESYKERKTYKQSLYFQNNAPLIEIPAHAFHAVHKGLWKRRLEQCLSSPKNSI